MNELIYQQGGTLVLDVPFTSQPTSATITIRDLNNRVLSVLGTGFADLEAEDCEVDDMRLTLPATNVGARVVFPTETVGTVPDLTAPGYQLLIDRGGRKHWVAVGEYDTDGVNVTSFRVDSPLPFALQANDKAYGIRVSYDVDWTAVTATFVGQIKATWSVVAGGKTYRHVKIYDVVKQTLPAPATWADVLVMRPDAGDQISEVTVREAIVTRAWETVKQDLYTLGIRFNLIVPDGSTTLKDAVVYQALYNLVQHQSLPVPRSFEGQGDAYLDRLQRDKDRAMSQLQFPVDENQDEVISPSEKTTRKAAYFRSPLNKRQVV